MLKERAAAVPWWVWVGAALLSHLAIRLVAGAEAGAALQYLVPALFIAAAVIGLRLRRTSARAPSSAAGGLNVAAMRWREFEALIGRAFELQGYHMNDPGAAGSDASIELLMRKERQTYLVHCKTWRADKVGVETVHALRTAMQARGAVGGFVLSSGRFSREASAVASTFNIRLVDGPALQALLVQGRTLADRAQRGPDSVVPADVRPAAAQSLTNAAPTNVAPAGAASADVARADVARADAPAAPSAEWALPCPLCGGDMKKRLAKRGVNAGQYFWGCVRHPECRGTRRVREG
jgi:restriction system protein